MPVMIQDDARRMAVERLRDADCIWSDVAIPYRNRVSLTLPSAFRGQSVQVLFFPLSKQGDQPAHDEEIDDGMSLALSALPEKYAKGNWNGYDEKPLNAQSYDVAMSFSRQLPQMYRNAEIGVDADGEVTFEWYRAKDRQCSLTFAASGSVYCVVRNNGDRITAIVSGRAVGKILDLISEVVNA
ncbi:MAG: hypothetical protein IJQ73_15285 [Kiritimatiellae bacterium]|nr:hypothetical protein [Kiritimatiellia bacterium]